MNAIDSSHRDAGCDAVILLVEDNPAEQRLVQRTLSRGIVPCDLRIASDGEQALDYLHQRGDYADPASAPRPDLVLLDLNMPRIDGRQVLANIRQDPALKTIPVVVMTTSKAEQDIVRSYELGCNSYLNKPVEVPDCVQVLAGLQEYWFKLVVLPSGKQE